MRYFADLHFHSKYSRAVSKDMELDGLNAGAKRKGLNLLGTGDFTHPLWFKELKSRLEDQGNGLYRLKDPDQGKNQSVWFMLTCEVSTLISTPDGVKKVHHILHVPSLDQAAQINELLSKRGNLAADGRPMFGKTSPAELVELVRSVSKDVVVVPAHIWTPWFSVFGSKSGFDSITEAYQDQARHIFALETGMSSDPAMNWRISGLDQYTLMSNSDSHSPHPWRLGRECNVFEFSNPENEIQQDAQQSQSRANQNNENAEKQPSQKIGNAKENSQNAEKIQRSNPTEVVLSYGAIWNAVRKKDQNHFKFTIETAPAYGKYHWDGHRACGFSCPPEKTRALKEICPVCHKPLTIGVEYRVEELADRPAGFVPKDAIPFQTLLPLHELIASVIGSPVASPKVARIADGLIDQTGSELAVLMETPENQLVHAAGTAAAKAILANRGGNINVKPGFDGEYGQLTI